MEMKRTLTTIATLLLTITVGIAQTLDLMHFHYIEVPPDAGYETMNLMQRRNGDIVSKTGVGYDLIFYKVSPTSLEITDSLYVYTPSTLSFYGLSAKDPRGEGNLRIYSEHDGEGGTNLRISHFTDDDLACDPSQDIVVPLCDSEVFYYSEGIIDCRGDLIWKYYTPLTDTTWQSHFARFGLDGTLKHDAVMTPNQILLNFDVFSEQPLRYYQWMRSDNLYFYVYDSLFRQENYYVVNKGFHPDYSSSLVHFKFSYWGFERTYVIPDGDDILVAAEYEDFSSGPGWPVYANREVGTAVARYELRTMRQKGLVMFNDYPGPENNVINLGFFKSSNECLYLVYKEHAWDEHDHEISLPITAVKMDPDLNVLWKRYIYMPKDFALNGVDRCIMNEEEDEVKIVCTGSCTKWDYNAAPWTHTEGMYYFFLTDDDPLETDESEIKIRPYAFWPNPVQDQLSLKYSPDLQPQAIELFDLQGRLVRSQTANFKSLSMEGLAAGQYVMKVTMEDGKVFTDKVVKE